jgi:hypothetical protein
MFKDRSLCPDLSKEGLALHFEKKRGKKKEWPTT